MGKCIHFFKTNDSYIYVRHISEETVLQHPIRRIRFWAKTEHSFNDRVRTYFLICTDGAHPRTNRCFTISFNIQEFKERERCARFSCHATNPSLSLSSWRLIRNAFTTLCCSYVCSSDESDRQTITVQGRSLNYPDVYRVGLTRSIHFLAPP